MVVYTFATLAFYLLGAATLSRIQLNPEKSDMIRTLAVMYEPVFGAAAQHLFLFGAFAVLYSTFFVANAAHARVCADAMSVLGLPARDEAQRLRRVRFFSGLFPLLCLVVYVWIQAPVQLVLLSGTMQALMLPMLAVAGLYFRYFRCDDRIAPGRAWDIFLWLSAVGMLITGGYLLLAKLMPDTFA
jgi:Mn2+/Fe2+ NRAMP family transporter